MTSNASDQALPNSRQLTQVPMLAIKLSLYIYTAMV